MIVKKAKDGFVVSGGLSINDAVYMVECKKSTLRFECTACRGQYSAVMNGVDMVCRRCVSGIMTRVVSSAEISDHFVIGYEAILCCEDRIKKVPHYIVCEKGKGFNGVVREVNSEDIDIIPDKVDGKKHSRFFTTMQDALLYKKKVEECVWS